ncbi:type I phosphodiesterase / nucleotide pyrophosphatase domain-containing protein [Ditylenchus destructor]|uniref:Type I phosphodiesterase / nucleotide pyrophosphatase domain-containing protein n=1 Tax=Ditylenchus destructor TaxID=166010 RepID=A0AAD4R4L7_9BILA|nr:type I phosphodiesterase / nucleotide pyrophosphatase domain-containing protein [Ditylenchus destructor]
MVFLADLALLIIGYTVSLLVFQQGFLLKRNVLPNRSSCADVVTADRENCWIPAQFNKSIWLVIDALRYDFIEPHKYANNPQPESRYYLGQMPEVSNFLATRPKNARLFRFKADPPTTTFQRIKALVTGSIPAFIEIGDNFGGATVGEDNLADQLINSKRGNVMLLGDDTWLQLLPNRFQRGLGLASFDIKDLETVDNFVIENIYNELNQSDWNLLIAHCLGVDHCGHRYGPYHPEMRRKLNQMDTLIKNITEMMDDDTILFVMGDHGMTATGDHGGESPLELDAALFVFTKNNLSSVADTTIGKEVDQIDLVPTASLLLDIPIPFSNLGRVIESLMPESIRNKAVYLNAIQILRYAQEYTGGMDVTAQEQFFLTLRRFENTDNDDIVSNRETIISIQSLLRSSLNKFNLNLAFIGIFSFVDSILFNIYLLISVFGSKQSVTVGEWMFRSALVLLQLSLYFGENDGNGTTSLGDVSLFLTMTLLASVIYRLLLLFVWLISTPRRLDLQKSKLLISAFTVFHSASFLSNSFVIEESDTIRFMLQTFLLSMLITEFVKERLTISNKGSKFAATITNIFRKKNSWTPICLILFCMTCVRMGKWFESCREEHIDCIPYWATTINTNMAQTSYATDEKWFLIRIAFAVAGICILNNFLHNDTPKQKISQNTASISKGPSQDESASVYLTKAVSWLMVCIVIIHWLCEVIPQFKHMDSTETDKFLLGSQRTAQLIYAITIVHFILTSVFCPNSQVMLWAQRQTFVLTVAMVLGDIPAMSLAMMIMSCVISGNFVGKDPITLSFLMSLFGGHAFFALGHQNTLTSIPWTAAFVGIPGNFWVKCIPAFLLHLRMKPANLITTLLDLITNRRFWLFFYSKQLIHLDALQPGCCIDDI